MQLLRSTADSVWLTVTLPLVWSVRRGPWNSLEVILSQITEALKEYHWKLYGVREVSNPLLYIPGDLYKGLPVEVLHTILLGCYKGILEGNNSKTDIRT